jgi:hypothetical protein
MRILMYIGIQCESTAYRIPVIRPYTEPIRVFR